MPWYKGKREIMEPDAIGDKKVVVVAEGVWENHEDKLLDGRTLTTEEYESIFFGPLEGEEADKHYLLVYDNKAGKTISRLYKEVA